MAEWFKAAVLKTASREHRQASEIQRLSRKPRRVRRVHGLFAKNIPARRTAQLEIADDARFNKPGHAGTAMKRFPENAKEGEPQALIPNSEAEWLGIETDISGGLAIKIIAAALASSAAATFAIISYWQGWWS